MPGVESRDFASADETRTPDKTRVDLVSIAGSEIGRYTFEPGWRWSECIKPVVKTESCQLSHVGFCVSGKLTVQTADGNQINIAAHDSYSIPPGHDAWVEGDEPFTGVEFVSAAVFAKSPE